MKPLDLIETAKILLTSNTRKPTSVSCRRAVSACYYALFHCIAKECANLLIGGTGADRSNEAWRQVYRALEHNHAKGQCEKVSGKGFPQEIEDFASAFVTMQKKRHDADYDPFARFVKSSVQTDILLAEGAVNSLMSAPKKDRRAFCAWVLLKKR